MSDESRNINSINSETTTSTIIPSNSNKNILTMNNFKYTRPKRKPLSTPDLSLKMSNKIRKDIFGEIIKKGGKQKISFKDNILLCDNESNDDSECLSENKAIKKDKNFVEIIDVISYKEQNKQMSFKGNGEIPNDDIVCCESCEIF